MALMTLTLLSHDCTVSLILLKSKIILELTVLREIYSCALMVHDWANGLAVICSLYFWLYVAASCSVIRWSQQSYADYLLVYLKDRKWHKLKGES